MSDMNTAWHGVGESKTSSLFEHYLLVRWDRIKKKYQCAYRIGKGVWGISNISKNIPDNLFCDDNFDMEKFLNDNRIGLKDWQELSFLSKLDKLLAFLGTDKIFGAPERRCSTREICKYTKVAYLKLYELI